MKKIRSSGFTIIELLAAMAVLLIMVALLSRVFGSAASTWRAGNKRIESNNTGRSAMEFMARELSGMIVDPSRPSMAMDSDYINTLGMMSDRITFVTLSHKSRFNSGKKYRDVQQVHYAVAQVPGYTNRFGLYRWVTENFDSSYFTSYSDDDWYESMYDQSANALNCGILADNIRNFEVFITPLGESEPQSDYTYSPLKPPAVIDIYLEVLAEDDAVRAALTPNDTTFINAATRRYATRIYVQNRAGYIE